MIGAIGNMITKLFGKKSDKDIQEILPLVKQVLAEQEKLKNATSDELRANSDFFRKEIQEYIKSDEDQIAKIKEDANASGLGAKKRRFYTNKRMN